jgi:hypothetical protein
LSLRSNPELKLANAFGVKASFKLDRYLNLCFLGKLLMAFGLFKPLSK